MTRLTLFFVALALLLPSSAFALTPTTAPGKHFKTNWPVLTWSSSDVELGDSVLFSMTGDVDEAGKLVSPVRELKGIAGMDTSDWESTSDTKGLPPGTYYWQVEVHTFTADSEDPIVSYTAPRVLYVDRFVGHFTADAGDTDEGQTTVAFPYTFKMPSTLAAIPLRLNLKINGRRVCSANRTMTHVSYVAEDAVSLTVTCRAPKGLFKAEGRNRVDMVLRVGSKGTTGRIQNHDLHTTV